MIAQYSGPDRKLEYLFQHANEVSLSPILTTGTPLATLTIDGQQYTLYCTTGGGGGGSTVSYNSLITSGTALGELTINGIKYTIYSKDSSKVAYSATQTSGTQIGTLTIDGTPYVLYAPNGGGQSGSSYTETTLWTGTGDMLSTFSVTLAHAYTNYDELRFEYESGNGVHNYNTHYDKLISKDTLSTAEWFSISDFYLANGAGVNTVGQFTDSTHLSVMLHSYNWFTSCTLTKIVGIKYGDGGGSSTLAGLSDVDVSSPVDGQILRYDGVNQQWVNSNGSYSETILFTGGTPSDTTFTLSDTITHYNTINVYYRHNDGTDDYIEVKSYPASFLHSLVGTSVNVLGLCNDIWYYYFHVTDDTHFAYSKSNAGYISDIIGVTS